MENLAEKNAKSLIFEKFKVQLMRDGKKTKAEHIFNKIVQEISLRGESPSQIILLAVNNVKPLVEVRNIRVKGNTYPVPFPLSLKRQLTFAIRQLIETCQNKKKELIKSLAFELISSAKGESETIKKTASFHRLARQNRLFIHYRWF